VLIRPFFSVVMGHVGDIGEFVATNIPFERVSTTTYLNQRGIPIEMMEDVMAKCKQSKL
jgi:transposase